MSRTNLKGAIGSIKREAAPTEARLPLEDIQTRDTDTRPLNPAHVEALAESIAALGLIQPIAVDVNGVLLAGGHRRAAIEHLQQHQPKAFDQWFSSGVPVHSFDFDVDKEPQRALAIEATENERRLDYTPAEVRALADKLRSAGFQDLKGRPKKGQRSVVLGLSTIIGKSHNTVRRYLADDGTKKATQVSSFSDAAKPTVRSLNKLIACEDCPDDVAKLAARLLKKLDD